MALETGTYISDLVITNPAASDLKSQGDDHLRLLKSTIKATFPNVSGAVTPTHTELNYVDGVTSAIQTQIDAKAAKAGDTYTGTHNYTGATVTVATPSAGSNPATKDYADGLAFSTALPAQTGNKGKRVKTDGSAASWDWSGIRLASISGGTLADTGSYYSILANASYTLPDYTGSEAFGLLFPTNASAVPTSVTTNDGWSIATGAVAGTLRVLTPVSTANAHGVWLGQTMTPPTLATITGSANHTIIGTVQLDTNLFVVMFRDPGAASGNVYAVAVNTATYAVGAVLTFGTAWTNSQNAASAVIYADSTTSFVVGYKSATAKYTAYACSVNTGTLAITAGTVASTPAVQVACPMIKLANGTYVLSVANATDLYVMTVSGTTCTVGTGVASGTVGAGAQIARVSNTEFLAAYGSTGGGTTGTRRLDVRTYSVSGTVPTGNAVSSGSNIYAEDIRLVKAFSEGSSYLVCCKDGTTATTGNYHGVTVSGTTATLGAISAQANNLPALYGEITYTYKPAEAVIRYNSTTMLLGHLAAGPFAIGISGSTLTVGSSGGPATTTSFLKDTATGANFYAVGASAFDKLSVSGTTVSSSWQVAAVPVIVQSDTLTDKAVSYSGTWYAWTLPTMQVALQDTKWLYRSGNNLLFAGPLS